MADSKQREIKFRAWDETAKVYYYDIWLYGDHIGIPDNELRRVFNCEGQAIDTISDVPDHYDSGGDEYVFMLSGYVLEQFTGLQDRNGKDIFEGDILNCIYLFDGCKKHKLIIEFDNDYSLFRTRNIGECYQPGVRKTMRAMTASEVIGNKWENPELLKGSND